MEEVNVNGRRFRPFVRQDELDQIVVRLAREVSGDYEGKELMVCPMLTGAYMFAADLVRHVKVDCEVRFVRYTSYDGMQSRHQVEIDLPFSDWVEGKDVLIVEDVVDSGLSMQFVLSEMAKYHPRSVKVCSLFYKPSAFRANFKVDYVGREIGNEFIVGYGMDYDERGRTLPEVYVISDETES